MDGEDEPTGMYSRRLRTQHYITTEKRAARRSEFLECAKLPLFKDENMCFRNTQNSYGAVSKTFHWVIAVLVIIMLCAGVSFHYLTRGSSVFNVIMFIHKSTGVTILGLMILRLFWRWINPNPIFPIDMPTWQKIAARVVHLLFYVVLIAMPITGIIMSLAAGYPVPFWGLGNLHLAFIIKNKSLAEFMFHSHNYLAWTIAVLIVIHTLASLKHYFIDKDNVMQRMF